MLLGRGELDGRAGRCYKWAVDPRVRLLVRGEVGDASRLLARAFAADPFIGYLLADPSRRRLAFPSFFRAVLYELTEFGTVYAVEQEGAVIGVAAWAPPGVGSPRTLARLRAWASMRVVRGLFPRGSSRLLDGFAVLAEHHPHLPHWYLAFVGIEPSAQGRGAGRTLLGPVLERADEDRTPCYLETPFPATLTFYRRLGFELTAELKPVAGAPPVWTMTRPPSAGITGSDL